MATRQEELEEQLAADPDFAEAMRNATAGEYSTTLFQMWEETLDLLIKDIQLPMSLGFADAMLRQWPWLNYEGVKLYQERHLIRLTGIKDVLVSCYPKPAKFLFKENVADWDKHKEAYKNLLVAWTRLTDSWVEDWNAIPLDQPLLKGAEQASIQLSTTMLISQNGFLEQIRHLSGYEISDEEGAEMDERITAVDDE